MIYTWTTERGAKIALDIDKELATEKKVWADGYDVLVPCHEWRYTINSLTINGEEKEGAYKTWAYGKNVFCVGRVGKQNAYVIIPDDVEDAIWGEEEAYKKEQLEKALAVEVAYEKHYAAVRKMLDDE